MEPEPQPLSVSMLLEIAAALHDHLLPQLSLQTLMTLSRTCSAWHDLIMTCPFQQLPLHTQHKLLPSTLSTRQPFREVLRTRATLMGKVRG